jgi:hypothetical protein
MIQLFIRRFILEVVTAFSTNFLPKRYVEVIFSCSQGPLLGFQGIGVGIKREQANVSPNADLYSHPISYCEQ